MHNLSLPAVCRSLADAGQFLLRQSLPIVLSVVLLGALLTGCSGGGGSSPATGNGEPGDDLLADELTPVFSPEPPAALLQLADDPGLLVALPEVLGTVTAADTGVQVAYTRDGQDEQVPFLQVESQWRYMQDCLQLVGVAPLVLVREEDVTPFTLTDDVIFDIEGIPVASGSRRAVPVLQIREDELDPSRSNPGFHLRSIMGRVLWLSASLAERDYPFACAQGRPEVSASLLAIGD